MAGNSCLALRSFWQCLGWWKWDLSQLLHKRRCRRVAAKLLFGRGRPAKKQLRRLCWRFGNYFFAFFLNFSAPTTLPRKGWKIWYYDWISVCWYHGDIFWWKCHHFFAVAGNSCLALRSFWQCLGWWKWDLSQLLHKRRCRRVAAKLLFGRGRPAKKQLRRLCWRFGNYFFAFFLNFSAPTTLPRKGWKIWYYDWISVCWYHGDIFWWKNLKMRTGPLGVSI